MSGDITIYAPYAVMTLTFLIQLRIFARTEELKKLESYLMTYAMEHFVTKDMYADNHKALQNQMLQIHHDISEVKNMLISMIRSREV